MPPEIAAGTATVAAAYRKYACAVCGYIYNEELGDPDEGFPPGTRYENIPDDWSCPDCGVSKRSFRLLAL
jgi:rubredoxin---NAD+ reductase